jgi:hypothetical protein
VEDPVFVAYVVLTVTTIAYNVLSAILDFGRFERILVAMRKAGVPTSWLPTLGALKALGALGLVVGFVVPAIGVAAAAGLTLFFAGAVITHLRARDYSFGLQHVFLPLAAATLALQIALA